MKRAILATALTLSLVSTMAIAQPMHTTAEGNQPRQMGQGMMMGQGSDMMGGGGQGSGMMGSGSVAKRDAFLDSTKELRKSIHDKQFEYMEASRNSEETVGGLRKKAEELSALRQDLMEKRQKAFSKE